MGGLNNIDDNFQQSQTQILADKAETLKRLINSIGNVAGDLITKQKEYLSMIDKYANDNSFDEPYTAFSNNFMPKFSPTSMATDSDKLAQLEQNLNESEKEYQNYLSAIKNTFKELAMLMTNYNNDTLSTVLEQKDLISQAISHR